MTIRLSLLALGLAGWLTASAIAADDKVEVLARGPVHEAYAEPSERDPKPTPVVPKEPPKPVEELPPDQKPAGDNVQWMPGYWQWDADRNDFIWVSGFWRAAPPGRVWVPGSWHQADGGWQWTGGFWAAASDNPAGKADVDYLPQPPAPLDNAGPTTPAPDQTDVYVPGSWLYRDDHYAWRPGYWTEYEPGRVWVAACYRWTPAGYIFVDGYWDYPLADRGTLFAPAYIPPDVCADPGFVYTPEYVVQEPCLFGSLFWRSGFGSYYFGDYFGPNYASLGFTPWCGNFGVSVGFGRGWCDPLFNYYSCAYHGDPFWGGGGIFDLYAGRYAGNYLAPPSTLVQQNTLINNITNNTNVTNVTMLRSLNQVAGGGRRRFEPVSDPARQQFSRGARDTHQAAARRAATESQLGARRGAGRRSATLPTATTPGRHLAGGSGLKPATAPKPSAIGRTRPGPNPVSPAAGHRPSPSATRPTPALPRSAPQLPRTNLGASARSTPSARPLSTPLSRPTPALPRSAPQLPRTSPLATPSPRSFSSPTNRLPTTPSPALPRATPQLPRTTPTPRPSAAIPRAPSLPSAPRNFARPSAPAIPRSLPRPNVAPRSFARPTPPRAAAVPHNVARPPVSRPAPHASARPAPVKKPHR